MKHGGSVGPRGALQCEGGKTERGRGTWWEGRRTGGVKHQVTVYIPPRRHVAQTEEHQTPSLAKFTRQGQVYYTVALMHHLITLHSISLHMLRNISTTSKMIFIPQIFYNTLSMRILLSSFTQRPLLCFHIDRCWTATTGWDTSFMFYTPCDVVDLVYSPKICISVLGSVH